MTYNSENNEFTAEELLSIADKTLKLAIPLAEDTESAAYNQARVLSLTNVGELALRLHAAKFPRE